MEVTIESFEMVDNKTQTSSFENGKKKRKKMEKMKDLMANT